MICITWWNTSWSYRKKITLKTSTYLTANVTNDHAIYVKQVAADADFWGHVAGASGEDVRFVAADDSTELKYYLQRFDHTNDLMDAWVKVTDTFTSAADIFIYMYYGNAGAADAQDVANTIPNVLACYHCDEGTGTAVNDKTGAYNATATNSAIWDTATQKIGAAGLNCNALYSASQATLLDTTPANVVIEMWMKPTITIENPNTAKYVLDKTNSLSPLTNFIFGRFLANDGRLVFHYAWAGNEVALNSTTNSWTQDVWYHLVFAWDTTNGAALYVNGVAEASDATATTMMSNGTAYNFTIGETPRAGGYIAYVKLDEVRVHTVAINANEAKLLYRSGNGDLQTYGAEESAVVKKHFLRTKKYW